MAANAPGVQMPPGPNGATSSYVRLRGLPFVATEQEVAQWFASAPSGPIQVNRVLFTYNTTGRKSGEAYVELPDMLAERAVQVLNHRNMGARYVEVFLSSEGEMAQANVPPPVAGANGASWQMGGEPGSGSGGIMRLRGLPFNATPDLILQFFQGFEIPKGVMGVHLILGPNGRPNGEAFVEFASEEVADAALAKDHATIGTRYVEVFRATPEQMAQAMQRVAKSNNLAPMHMAQGGMHPGPYGYGMAPFMHAPMMGGMGAMVGGPGSDAVLKMRGLPYKVTRNDILDFFSGLSVPLNGVHLMFNEREQPTGEAYVEFSSPEDRERAMTKDRQHIGGRYVELFRVNRGEMLAALEQFVGGYMSNQMAMAPGMGAQASMYGAYGAMPQNAYGQAPAFVNGPPTCGGPGAYANMQQHLAVMPGGVVIGQRDGRATGDCFVTFSSAAEAQRAMVMNNKHMGQRYVELFSA